MERRTGKDCYVVDPKRQLLGPFDAVSAGKVMASCPLGAVVFRNCQVPVVSEDDEGLRLLFSAPEASRVPLPPLPPTKKPAIFNEGFAFSCSCTQHYTAQKEWFKKRQEHRETRLKGTRVRSSSSRGRSGRQRQSRGEHSQRFGQVMRGSVSPLWQLRTAAVRMALFLGAMFLVARPHAYDPTVLPGYGLPRVHDVPALRARAPEGLSQLSEVVGAKLAGDNAAYARELLRLLPHHRLFHDELLPHPQVVAALSLFYLHPRELERSPSWRPLLRLQGSRPHLGLSAVAHNSRKLMDLVSVTRQRALGALGASVPSLDERAGGVVPGYWGMATTPPAHRRLLNDTAARVGLLLLRISQPQLLNERWKRLGAVFRARALWDALGFFAGTSMPLTSSQAPIRRLLGQISYPDTALLRHFVAELSHHKGVSPSRAALEKRFSLLQKLHQQSDFLCQPGASELGLDFLFQTVRLALSQGVSLPPLGQVFSNCFVRPAPLLPVRRDTFLNETEGLLAYHPVPPLSRSVEARLFPQWARPLASSEGLTADESRSQWLALLVLSSSGGEGHRELLGPLFRSCQGAGVGQARPTCWRLRWEVLVSGRTSSFRVELRQYLQQSRDLFSPGELQEAAFQWLVGEYLRHMNGALGELPADPVLFARRFGLEEFLRLDRSHFNSLEWYARHGRRKRSQ